MGTLTRSPVLWVLFFGLWLGYVGDLQPADCIAGAIAAAVATTAAEIVFRTGLVKLRMRPRAFVRAWRVPLDTVLQFGVIVAALARGRPHGAYREVEAPRGAGAFEAWADTISPNDYVLAVEGRRALKRVLDSAHARERLL